MTQEWATWDDMYQDDMYQYVEDANPKFETSNLSADSCARVHANVLLVGHASGRMVNARGFDLGNRQFAAAPADTGKRRIPATVASRPLC